jgi:hypothetical protein
MQSTINQNSLNFQGYTSPNPVYNTNGQSVSIVYSGATQGWIPTVDDDVTNEVPQTLFSRFFSYSWWCCWWSLLHVTQGLEVEVLEVIEILILLNHQVVVVI